LRTEQPEAFPSALGSQLTRNHPSFDPRNYGVSKLRELMRKQGFLEVKEAPLGDGSSQVHLYVRRKAGPGTRN
jgi:OST-HTH/LOTUS domain